MGKTTTTAKTTATKTTKAEATALKRPPGAAKKKRAPAVKKVKKDARVARLKDAPKGARAAWSLYLRDESPKPEYADLSSKERMRAISVSWKGESAEVKTKYHRLEAEDKVRHEREMASLSEDKLKEITDNSKARRKVKKRKREAEYEALGIEPPPKNPPSTYLRFSARHHQENSKKPKEERTIFKEMAGLISKKWKDTSLEDRVEFKDAYEADLIKYESDMSVWTEVYREAKAIALKERKEEMRRGHEKAVQAMAIA